ncbi:uncharacterized protein [Watersipora subatra]|uniref:uncharacterized protein isoform X2 n=1 Tax=Watersipora subatra TaxID=2589382 RepID=UPI00355BC2FB
MDYLFLQSFIIQFLLAMGLANDHDRVLDEARFLTLKYSINMLTPENMTGATFYTNNRLLIYSETILTIIDLLNYSQPLYKHLFDFKPRKLVDGFRTELLILSYGKHCVRSLNLNSSQISDFSGDCQEAGFVDGDNSDARYDEPSDMQKSGDHFYIADYNNDCIRRLWSNGSVNTVISIHSHPFEIAGDLYVAAQPLMVNMRKTYKTYVNFIDDVNVASMESCSSLALSLLSNDTDKHLKLLPLSLDAELHPHTIAGPFDGLVCHENVTMVIRLISFKPKHSTMQIYSVDTLNATRGTSSVHFSATTAATPSSVANSVYSTIYSFITYNSTSEKTIVPLYNHAHKPFDHLPTSYKENNKEWSVILPVTLAIVTLVVVLAAFFCIVYKSFNETYGSGRRVSENGNENEMDESRAVLLSETSMSQPEIPFRYSHKTFNGVRPSNGSHYDNEHKTNGYIPISNGNGGLVRVLSD